MVNYRRTFRLLTLILLLALIPQSKAWAKVTYHILTRPITTQQRPMGGNKNIDVNVNEDLTTFRTNVRVEALRCYSNVLTVGLPSQYMSPLATNYKYYQKDKIDIETKRQLYGYNDTTYDLYYIKDGASRSANNVDVAGSQIAPGTAIADGSEIYVTYEYVGTNDILDLTGTKEYNIEMDATSGNKDVRFLCLNADRNNRPGGMKVSKIVQGYLASDDIVRIENGVVNGKHRYYFIFKFTGSDPYNITIETAYAKGTTYQEEDKNQNPNDKTVYKEYRGASLFSQLTSGGSVNANMWLSADANTQWQKTGGAKDAAVGK